MRASRSSERILAGRYRLDALIGSGGAADVHRGVDLRMRRPVAVKVFRAGTGFDTEEDFRREAVILGRLQHPGLVTAYDAGRHDGDAYLVMQLIDGPTLKTRIAEGPLTCEATAALGAGLADALAHAHEAGIIHRDVKPSNILLDASDRPHLTDFGISRLLDATTRTATGTLIGTAAYLSPEQVLGRPVGRPADVYALGLVLLECLTGRLEYDGGPLEAAIARVHRPPVLPEFLPDAFAALLRRMTDLDEAARPTARDCARALSDLAAATAIGAAAETQGVPGAVSQAAGYADDDGTHHRTPLPGPHPFPAATARHSRAASARGRLVRYGSAAALAAAVAAGLVVTDNLSQHSAGGEAAPSTSDRTVPSASPSASAAPPSPTQSASARSLGEAAADSSAVHPPSGHPGPGARTSDATRGVAAVGKGKVNSPGVPPGRAEKAKGKNGAAKDK
ncbi:serine/threonine-protein kinase [Streptomyces sp. 7R007]